MPVSLSSWSHLRTFQPIQSGAGAMGEGKLYFLHGMSEGMSRRTWAGGDFPVAGVHTVRQVCGGLPREMPAFLQKAEEVIVGKLSDAGRAGGRRLRRSKEKKPPHRTRMGRHGFGTWEKRKANIWTIA